MEDQPGELPIESDPEQPLEQMSDDAAQAEEPVEMTTEQLAEAKRYGREELVCDLIDRAIDLTYLAIMALLLAGGIDGWLLGFNWLSNDWIRLSAMFCIVMGGHICVSFPLSVYSGHVIEHKYGLSRQTFGRWLWRYAKRNLLTVVFGLVMIEGLFLLIRMTGPYWWLATAGAFFLVSAVLGQLVPVLILPLFYKIDRLEDDEMNERFAQLSAGTGLSIEGVYRMEMSQETAKANAMLAGLGSTRRVILGDTLLDGFTPSEIEVIFAHEVGHHVHRHIVKMMVAGLLYSTVSFFLCDRVLTAWVGHVEGSFSYESLPIHALPLLMLVITVLSQFLEPLQNGISRHFERQSDTYALKRTRDAASYQSAFRKLARLNKSDPDPHPVEVFLFHSHPPISERLALVRVIE